MSDIKTMKDTNCRGTPPCGLPNQEAVVRYYEECRSLTWTCGCYEVDDLAGGYEILCSTSKEKRDEKAKKRGYCKDRNQICGSHDFGQSSHAAQNW